MGVSRTSGRSSYRAMAMLTVMGAIAMSLTGLSSSHAADPVRTISVTSSPQLGNSDLRFQETQFGSSRSATITITNDGPDLLTISSIEVKGYGKADYAISNNTCTTAPMVDAASCSLTLTFTPTRDGNNVGALVIESDATAGTPNLAGGRTFVYLKGLGYGVCADEPFAGGDGTDGNPYMIETVTQFNCINATTISGYRYLSKHFALGADLDAGGVAGTMWPIGSWDDEFTGSFDGGGHSISGFTVDDVWGGLFGFPGTGSRIFDLVVVDANVTSIFDGGVITPYAGGTTFADITIDGGTVTGTQGYSANGGAFGFLTGSNVIRVSSSADVLVTARDSSAYVGGLVGLMQNGSTISQSFSTGDVSATYVTPPADPPPSWFAIGGLAGQVEAGDNLAGSTVSNSYATGAVSITNPGTPTHVGGFAGTIIGVDSSVTHSYASGAVSSTGAATLGGFVGTVIDGAVLGSLWNTESSGNATDGAISGTTGVSSAQMRSLATYAGWDIELASTTSNPPPVWVLRSGYPAALSWTNPVNPSATPASQTVNGTVGTAITATESLNAIGFQGTVTYAVAPALPAGLSLNVATGAISGTPTTASANASYTITATGSEGGEATAAVSVTVAAAPTPASSGGGTSQTSQPPAAKPSAGTPAPSRVTEPVAPVSNPTIGQQTYRQPVAAQRLTSTVTLVPATIAATTPMRTVRQEPSPLIGSAPRVSATLNQPVKLLVQGFVPGAAYVVQMKSSTGYVVLGTVVANANGQLELPTFRSTRPAETTIAIVASTGKASYIKVNASTGKKKAGARSAKSSTVSAAASTAGSAGRR